MQLLYNLSLSLLGKKRKSLEINNFVFHFLSLYYLFTFLQNKYPKNRQISHKNTGYYLKELCKFIFRGFDLRGERGFSEHRFRVTDRRNKRSVIISLFL